MEPFLLRDVFPDVAKELQALLLAGGESLLAGQVESLRIVDRCRCTDDFCAMFYTVPRPAQLPWGPGHRNVALDPQHGNLILDVVDDRIVAVEILYRDEIRDKLRSIMPETHTGPG
jgi:hypothetical protein